MTNPTTFAWTDPTTNTDGSAITAGEITGFNVGIRQAAQPAGVYPITLPVASPSATSALIAAVSPALAPGDYVAAVQTVGPTSSAWSNEAAFSLAAPVPSAPTGFSIA